MSAVITQKPDAFDFTGRMKDIIIDSSNSVNVQIKFKGELINEEEYAPDDAYKIRVRDLGRLCRLCLWGDKLDYRGEQVNHGGLFTFVVEDTSFSSRIYYSDVYRKEAPPAAGVLSDCKRRITYPGCTEIVSGFPIEETLTDANGEESTRYLYRVYALSPDGVMIRKEIELAVDGSMPLAYTVELDVSALLDLFEMPDMHKFIVEFDGGHAVFLVVYSPVPELRHLRFRNLYDLPEVVHFTGGLALEAANESETAEVDGVKRKYGVKVKDDYKIYSGSIHLGDEYRLWRDLCNSKEVELYIPEYGWAPVVIAKHKLIVDVFKNDFKQAELTLNLADERLSGIDNI